MTTFASLGLVRMRAEDGRRILSKVLPPIFSELLAGFCFRFLNLQMKHWKGHRQWGLLVFLTKDSAGSNNRQRCPSLFDHSLSCSLLCQQGSVLRISQRQNTSLLKQKRPRLAKVANCEHTLYRDDCSVNEFAGHVFMW